MTLPSPALFLDAATRGDLGEVRLWLEKNPALLGATDQGGNTALHRAAWKNHFDTVRFLLEEKGVAADIGNKNGDTPLQLAAPNHHVESVTLLITHGADPNRPTRKRGMCAWMLAACGARDEGQDADRQLQTVLAMEQSIHGHALRWKSRPDPVSPQGSDHSLCAYVIYNTRGPLLAHFLTELRSSPDHADTLWRLASSPFFLWRWMVEGKKTTVDQCRARLEVALASGVEVGVNARTPFHDLIRCQHPDPAPFVSLFFELGLCPMEDDDGVSALAFAAESDHRVFRAILSHPRFSMPTPAWNEHVKVPADPVVWAHLVAAGYPVVRDVFWLGNKGPWGHPFLARELARVLPTQYPAATPEGLDGLYDDVQVLAQAPDVFRQIWAQAPKVWQEAVLKERPGVLAGLYAKGPSWLDPVFEGNLARDFGLLLSDNRPRAVWRLWQEKPTLLDAVDLARLPTSPGFAASLIGVAFEAGQTACLDGLLAYLQTRDVTLGHPDRHSTVLMELLSWEKDNPPSPALVDEVLRRYPKDLVRVNQSGAGCLHQAAQRGNRAAYLHLLERGAVEGPDEDGKCPIDWVSKKGVDAFAAEVARYHLTRGIQDAVRDNAGTRTKGRL
jgi:hypothetical protein